MADLTSDRPSILVVDDSNFLRTVLKEELEAEGFGIHVADNGIRCLEIARDLRPSAILLDVELGEMDGFEVCRRVRSDRFLGDTPVLIVSSYNELTHKLTGFEAGCDDYLTKPFFTKELVARIRYALRTRDRLKSTRRLGRKYLETLFNLGSAITSPFTAEEEVEIILRQCLAAVRAARGVIFLLDPEDEMLVVKGTQGYPEGNGGPKIEARCRVTDKLRTESSAFGIRVDHTPEGSTAFLPMVAKERLIGGIEIHRGEGAGFFSSDDQKILHALASQAAIFIENARLERDVRTMFLNIIVSMAGAVDAKDPYTHGHSLRVARGGLILGRQLGLPRESLEPLLLAGILHDVGKIGIPDRILKKPRSLTAEEFAQVKDHPDAGARMLAHIPSLSEVIPGIRHHHESWDGSGYPDGLAAEAIPLAGRIIHIADTLDAITTDRPYHEALPMKKALGHLEDLAGTRCDPALVASMKAAYREGQLHDGMSEITPTLSDLIDQIR